MTFLERYKTESNWAKRCIIMELYHLARITNNKNWTLTMTARDFDCSIGLVSENLKLANAIHKDEKLAEIELRMDALKRINQRKFI